jgi:hypothetical protein
MEVRRIGPDGGFLREFKDVRKRVQHLETRPSGNIVIRQTMETTDPETGVKTVFGQLPDGRVGLQEWINDVEPPDQPSAPIATAYLGVLSVYWDGVGSLGEEVPPDYDRTDVEMASSTSGPWYKVGELRGEGSVQVTDSEYGVERWFRLISVDKVGNASTASGLSSATAAALVEDQTIVEIIDRINADAAAVSGDLDERLTDLTDEISTYPARIDDAAASLVTDARLAEASLTTWPFVQNTIPQGSFVPGAIDGSDIADFALAVTKLHSNRHQIY